MSDGDEHEEPGSVSPAADASTGERISEHGLREASSSAAEVARADSAGAVEESGENEGSDSSSDQVRDEVIQAELVERFSTAIAQAVFSESFSGLLPHPTHWNSYDEATRERIVRMSEAFTTDESSRRDRLVDAEIAEAPKGRRMAFWIMICCLALAGVSVFVFKNNIAAGVFLAVPVLTVIRDFIRGRTPANKKQD